MGFFPDNRRFFAASLDGTLRVWSLPTAKGLLTNYAVNCGHADKCVVATAQGDQTFSRMGRCWLGSAQRVSRSSAEPEAQRVLWCFPDEIRWVALLSTACVSSPPTRPKLSFDVHGPAAREAHSPGRKPETG